VTFGERIKAYRRLSGLTQEELGTASGWDKNKQHRIEAGKTKPRAEEMSALSAALGVSVLDLYGESACIRALQNS